MAADKQKNTPVIVMKKKRHIISPPPTEEHVIIPPLPPLPPLPELPELPSGTVENKMPAHQVKKKWTPEFINTSLEKVKALFPLLQAEEGGFRPLKIGITRDVTDFITLNPDIGLTLPEWQVLPGLSHAGGNTLSEFLFPVLYGMASMDYLPVSFLSMKHGMLAPFWHPGWPVKINVIGVNDNSTPRKGESDKYRQYLI